MADQNDFDEKIIENKELNIWEALIPVIALIIMLFYNVFYAYGDDALSGSNQFILLMGAAIAMIVGFFNKVSYKKMIEDRVFHQNKMHDMIFRH